MLAATKKKKGTVKGCSLFNHPIQQLSRGEVLWDDEYVEAMAEGRQPEGKTDWNRILKPIDPNAVKDEKITTCDEACEKAMCPLYRERPLQLFDDATWTSDGEEVKHFNIRCLGTDSSPCSFCSHESEVKTPPAKKPKKETSEFAEAAGFNKHDYEGEEESPKKMSATACKWCQPDPCIIEDDESRGEGKMIVDNLNAQEGMEMNNFRFALYRMCAHQLGYVGLHHILPRCVHLFIEKNFVVPGQKRAGFKPKGKAK